MRQKFPHGKTPLLGLMYKYPVYTMEHHGVPVIMPQVMRYPDLCIIQGTIISDLIIQRVFRRTSGGSVIFKYTIDREMAGFPTVGGGKLHKSITPTSVGGPMDDDRYFYIFANEACTISIVWGEDYIPGIGDPSRLLAVDYPMWVRLPVQPETWYDRVRSWLGKFM